MAAAAIGTAMGVTMETIRQTAYNFKAVEHRIEYTATKSRFAITMIQREQIRMLQFRVFVQ